jgi:hypothetical protein
MMETREHLVEYLRGKYKQALTPKQLEQEIPISTKQQSLLRQEKRFPIVHTNVGKSIYYSIYAVADFLLSDGEEEVQKPSKKVVQDVPTKAKRRITNDGSRVQNLSHLFNMRGFVANLEQQKTNIDSLILFFNTKIQHDELQQELSNNEVKTTSKKVKL